MYHFAHTTRRGFLKTSILGGVAALAAPRFSGLAQTAPPSATNAPLAPNSRVALTTGNDRSDITFRALTTFQEEIKKAIGDRRVVLKPNNVSTETQLAATHMESLEGILEFLKSIGKLNNVVIAESAASGPTMEGFENFRYNRLLGKYPVKLVDLDQEETELLYFFDERDFRPHAARISKMLLDQNNFIVSAARMKTHDRVVATLSLKNIIVGAPIKDPGFRWGGKGKAGAKNDKPITHGNGFRGINYNLFAVAPRLHPHLAVIDGFEGMQGNGPVGGTPVDHRVCVASLDWLAADRVGVELMGIDFAKVGYLNFCTQAGLGQGDLNKIEVVGEPVARHIKPYKLADNVEKQLIWMKSVQPA